MSEADTYTAPEHGWTCFHCGETFTTPGAAQDHFGFEPSSDPACRIKIGAERGLVMALRKAELEVARAWGIIHEENSLDAVQAMSSMAARYGDALRQAEEEGYERGLRDGRAMNQEAAE